jgi:DNA repair exonuclease SbcCD ATPase subunit
LRIEIQAKEAELTALREELQKWPIALEMVEASFALQKNDMQRDKEELEQALEDARLRLQEAECWHEEQKERMESSFRFGSSPSILSPF